MNKIVEYKIIMVENWDQLQYEVNRSIKEGWQPYGNFFMTETYVMIQPIVKYEED